MKKLLPLIIIGFLSQSCTPKISNTLGEVTYPPLEKNAEIFILENGEGLPANSEEIGDLEISASGFSMDCGYGITLEKAKAMARRSGANIVSLEEIKKPNLIRACYGLEAKMYRTTEQSQLEMIKAIKEEVNGTRLPSEVDYAVIHFYRPRILIGSGLGYKVRSEDGTIIGRVRNGEKFSYTITEFGQQTFKAKTESTTSVEINVEPGQEYFVQCGLKMGYLIAKPEMCIVENNVGIKEFEKLN